MKKFSTIILLVLLSSCCILRGNCPVEQPFVCEITPPGKGDQSRTSAQQVAIDLTAFAKLPVRADFNNKLEEKFSYIGQKLSDDNARCAMFIQLAACYKDSESRKDVLNLIDSHCPFNR